MSFLIQYTCLKCGYKSPDFGEDTLIDPLDMPELYICSCKKCQSMFHRSQALGEEKNICPKCGSSGIEVHPQLQPVPCPCCGEPDMQLKCIGTAF